MRKGVPIAGLLFVLSAAGLALFLWPQKIDATKVSRKAISQTVVSSGQVMPPSEVRIGSLVSSTVRSVLVGEGDAVVAGQVLVEFDRSEAEAGVKQAKAQLDAAKAGRGEVANLSAPVARSNLRRAEAQLESAGQQLNRERTLTKAGVTTPVQLEEAETAMAVAEAARKEAQLQVVAASNGGARALSAAAQVSLASAQLALAEERLRQHTIVAPTDGVILNRSVEPGDSILPGAALLRISAVGLTRIRIEPDERNLALLELGQKGRASTEAFPADQFDVTVTYIAPAVNPDRGTIEVQLLVENPPQYLRPHMTASAEIVVATKKDALVLPRVAIQSEARSPYVWTLHSSRVQRTPVELGLLGDDEVSVRTGLSEQDVILLKGTQEMKVGAKVTPRFVEGR